MRRKITKKIILFGLLSFIIVIFSIATDGSVAWLSSKTNEVTNTFTYGKIDIELSESDTNLDDDNDGRTNTYLMDLLDNKITKDALITVKEKSESCWLFVKLNQSENFKTYLEYEIGEGWTQLPNYEGIYFREVTKSEGLQTFEVFKDQTVHLKNGITHSSLNQLAEETYPKLDITAYAVQKYGIETAVEAWSIISIQ